MLAMELDTEFFTSLFFWVAVGWYWARNNARNALEQTKQTQRTLAIQALYLNGRGEISDEEFDVHDRVAKELDDLETLSIGGLMMRVHILEINAGMHPLELDSNE